MSVDFTPSRGEYTELKPFRYWCQKVLPLVYDDSLSYYELLSKILDALNKAMEDVETLNDDVTALYTAYTALQDWITDYVEDFFEGEGIQNAVNAKIDEMVVSGVFGTIVNDKVAAQINAVVASQLGTVVQGQLPSVVQTQIPSVVSDQLPGVVNNKIGDVADAWLQAHVQSQTGTLDHTINSSGSSPLSFPLKNLIQGVKGSYSFIDKYLLADYTDTDYHNDVINFLNIFKDDFTPPEYAYAVRSKFYKKGNSLVLTSYPDENWAINAYPSVIPITRNLIPPLSDRWDGSTNDAQALTLSGLSGLDKNAINKYFVNINSGDTIKVAFDLNLTYEGNFNGSLSLTGWKLIKVYVSNNAVTYQELAEFELTTTGSGTTLSKVHGECEYTFGSIDKETPGNPATIGFGLAIVTGEEIAWGHYSGNTNYMARSNTYDLTITGEVVDTEVADLKETLSEIEDIANIYVPSQEIDAVINSSTGVVSANANAALVWCECDANTIYTVSKTAGTRFVVACSTSIPTDGASSTVLGSNGTASKLTVTTNGTAQYLLAYVFLSTTDSITKEQMLASVKINKGTKVIDYNVTAIDRKAREELETILPFADTFVVRNDTILKGQITVNANTYSTAFMMTSGFVVGDYLYLYAFTSANTKLRPAIICYDANNQQTGQCYNNDHGMWSYIAFRIPDNTTKIEVGIRNYDSFQATFSWFVTTNQLDFNHLYGRNVLAFGDSVTFGANNKQGNVSKSYISIIAERNKMTLHNYAVSGATLVKAYANADKDRYRGCIYEKVVEALTAEDADFPDIIIMSGGFNDSANLYHDDDPNDPHPSPLGSFTENDFSGTYDTGTVIGAIEQCFYDLKQTFYWYENNANWIRIPKLVYALEYYEVVTPTWTTYRKEIKKVCEKWGVPCIDINDIIQAINANNMILKDIVFTDGTHMDSKSHIIVANGFENALDMIY